MKPIKSKDEYLSQLPEKAIRDFIDCIRWNAEGSAGAVTKNDLEQRLKTHQGLPYNVTAEDLQEELERRGLPPQSPLV